MNDIMSVIGPFLLIAITIVMYVLVVQVINDPTCAAIDRSATPIIGKWFVKALALCWW